eukprot:TRINITY_DN25177_c0_g1_i1.p1 TRINITY_DN25177_c0_g1~~TRINITY_DN25177_c0_g1_i1.p1  ORF type:complete len:123 (+),score=3.84 TRINITY_DN25177_c0_g1_i1:524-892(+)
MELGNEFTLKVQDTLFLGYDPHLLRIDSYYALNDSSLKRVHAELSFEEYGFIVHYPGNKSGEQFRKPCQTTPMWYKLNNKEREDGFVPFRLYGSNHRGNGVRNLRFGRTETLIMRAKKANIQ